MPTEEPLWGEYRSRVPVLQACSAWHQSLRELIPDAVRRKGIVAGWPKWQHGAGCWRMILSREIDNEVLVYAVVQPDGQWTVRLLDAAMQEQKKLEGQEAYTGDSQAGMEAAFSGIIEKANAAIAEHIAKLTQ